MTQLFHIPEQIKQEFRLDSDCKVTISIRGAARLANVDDRAIQKGLELSADLEPHQLARFLTENRFQGVDLIEWKETGIPDLAIALILEYYAYECRKDRKKEQAKKLCRVFRAIGIRSWIQSELDWQPQKVSSNRLSLSVSDIIALADNGSQAKYQKIIAKAEQI